MTLAAPEHQETNRQVEVTWRTSHTIAHSLMVLHDALPISGTVYGQNSKTLWYGEDHNRRSYGQARYVLIQIWDN